MVRTKGIRFINPLSVELLDTVMSAKQIVGNENGVSGYGMI